MPFPNLRAGFSEHPLADGHDQAAALRHSYELVGRHQAPFRVLPAEERFHPDDHSTGDLHLRLIYQEQLFSLQRQPQAVLQSQPLHHLSIHVFGEELEGIASLLFGAIHGRIGIFDQRLPVHSMFRENTDADATSHVEALIFNQEFSGHAVEDPVGGDGRFGNTLQGGQHDQEFVAAAAGHRIFFPDTPLEPFGNLLQEKIAERVSQRIVDDFEAVEIEKQNCDFLVVLAASAGQRFGQDLTEKSPIMQAGKGIVIGEKLDPCLGHFAVSDVFNRAFVEKEVSVAVAHRPQIHQHPLLGAIFVIGFQFRTAHYPLRVQPAFQFRHPLPIDE